MKAGTKKAVLVLGLVAVAGGGYFVWKTQSADKEAAANAWQFDQARRGTVSVQVTASGTLSALNQVDVGAQVSGRIKALYADFNDTVKKGQLIAVIDPALFESAKAQAQAKLESARADLQRAQAQETSAQLDAQRTDGLVAKGLASDAEKQTADLALKSAQAQVASARAAVTLAKAGMDQAIQNLEYCSITAPVDGIVISRNVEAGQTVAASLQAPTLFVIAEDLQKMELHTSVAEADVGQLSEGQRVEFTVDAWPNQTFDGTVRQVRYAATTVSNVVTYDAVVRVDNPKLRLRPGMTANATFVVEEQRDVLTVPNAALRFRPKLAQRPAHAQGKPRSETSPTAVADDDGGPRRGTVWVLEDGQPRPVRIEMGITDGSVTHVVSVVKGDLKEGTQLLVGEGGTSAAGAPGTPGGPQRANNRGPRGPRGIF